ncbi:S-layer homology domain-containing protein [Paenibacillus puldeungensis]|uniref:S-layer homology domain-containing protein n=1 Tax=Paenibacillus puldeungensis TaxID=696536 RepID=A0ABW3S0F8_9BACL
MKRAIFAFFAFVLGAGILPIQSFAAGNAGMSGDGSAGNPYVIMTLQQLDAVRNDLNAHYILGADIDATETVSWNDGSGFAPVGSYASDGNSHPFTGVFDGQGHVIRNLTMNWPDNNSTGLFANISEDGVVRNVGLEGGSITGGLSFTGSLAGMNYGSLERSYSSAKVSGKNVVGGLVGYNHIQGKVTYAHANAVVSGNSFIGGLVGRNDGGIEFSDASGDVNGDGYVGGLVGNSEGGEISQSYATGNVEGNVNVGGLIGIKLSGSVNNAYAIGNVTGQSAVGGLVGNTVDFGPITASYATGAVTGNSYVGGLIGSNNGVDLVASYWDTETTGQSNACGYDLDGLCKMSSGLSTQQAINQSSYMGWDFTNMWFMVPGSRPFLRSEWSNEIRNGHQLQLMQLNPAAGYKLMEDIDLGKVLKDHSRSDLWTTTSEIGLGFVPITSDFAGKLDGQGHTISGLYTNVGIGLLMNVGLFSRIAGGEVRDLQIKDSEVKGGTQTGMLAGEIGSGAQIQNVHVTGWVQGMDHAGGFVGKNSGKISGSSANVQVQGSSEVGGLVGDNSIGGFIEDSYAAGTVKGGYKVGGLVGVNDPMCQIKRSFADADVSGISFVGGLIGRNEGGIVIDTYATGPTSGNDEIGGLVGRNTGSVANSYAVGSVTGNMITGGLIGRQFGFISTSFYNKETTGQSDTGENRGVLLSTAEMKQNVTYGSTWDFGGTWRLEEGKTYPVLQGIEASLTSDAAPPTVVSAKVEGEHLKRIILSFDEDIQITNGDGVSVTKDGNLVSITGAQIIGTKALSLLTGEKFEMGQQILVSYDEKKGNITDMAGNRMLSFSDRSAEIIPPPDKTPPSITVTMTKADGSVYVDREWTNQSIRVSAEAADESSVTTLTYSLDNGVNYSPYLSEIVFSDDGIHTISFKAVDQAGNEKVEQRTVCISKGGMKLTPIIVKADGSAYTSGEWTNKSVTVSVYAETGIGELSRLTYQLNGGKAQAYENKTLLEVSGEGSNTLLFEAIDKAGNKLALELLVKIDKTSPAVVIEPNGSEQLSLSANSKVTVQDTGSGTNTDSLQYAWSTESSIPAAGWAKFSEGATLSKNGADGDWYLHIKAQDLAGNEQIITSYRFRLTARQPSQPITSPGESGSGSVDRSLPSNTYLVGLDGKTIDFEGGQIVIPAGAFQRPFYLTVHYINDMERLSLPEVDRVSSPVVEFSKDVPGDFEKDVTVKMRFNAVDLLKERDELWLARFDTATKRWVAADQLAVDWVKGLNSGTTRQLSKFVILSKPKEVNKGQVVPFTDVTGHWVQPYIEALAKKGALTGYANGSFKPNQEISRAEFASMLVKTLGLASQGNYAFADTENHWAKEFISTAYAAGILQGHTPNTFAPDDLITREQMAVMVVKALKLGENSAANTFSDINQTAVWAKEAVLTASAYGVIDGYEDHTFRPQAHATRAEAITLIWRILAKK